MTINEQDSNGAVPAEADDQAVVLARGYGEIVEVGYHALEQAETDFERLAVRDRAAAVAAAARALEPRAGDRGGLRAIQVKAAGLVATAERAVAQANPAKPPGDRGQGRGGKISPPSETDLDKRELSRFRKAHEGVDDEQFEDLKRQAEEKGKPLTRAAVGRFSKTGQPEPADMVGDLPTFDVVCRLKVRARGKREARERVKRGMAPMGEVVKVSAEMIKE